MNKPSWDDAPKWANYLAQDEGGKWFWYEDRPYPDSTGLWLRNDGQHQDATDQIDNWKDTLESRPKPVISINWDVVPERWNYFAIDSDGQCFFYAEKPEIDENGEWVVPSDNSRFDCTNLGHLVDVYKLLLKRPK